jgi:hypothetical protein
LCVALSRAKRRLIIVYNARIGSCRINPAQQISGEMWFAAFRLLLRRLGCEHLAEAPSSEQAKNIAHRVTLSVATTDLFHGLPGDAAVRSACLAPPESFEMQDWRRWPPSTEQTLSESPMPWSLAPIFDNYDRDVVGSLDRQAERPVDEDELAVEEAVTRHPQPLAQERLENAAPEEQEIEGKKTEAIDAAEAVEPGVEEVRSTEVVPRAILIKDSVLSAERFAVVVVKNMHLLFNARAHEDNLNYGQRTQLLKARDGADAVVAARTHLAGMWQWSLQRYYNKMWHEAVEAAGHL